MKRRCLAALLGVAACSGSLPDRELGAAADPQAAAYAIAGVRASPGTVHFTGLPWLIDSAEGAGPLVVTTNVGTFVMPAMSTTVTGVDPDKVSRRSATASSSATTSSPCPPQPCRTSRPHGSRPTRPSSRRYGRWRTRRPAPCSARAHRSAPSGVFFQTVPADHVALPDMGLITFVPGCEDLACALSPGPGGEVDAGTAERQAPGFLPSLLNPLLTGGGVIGTEGASPSPGRY